MKITCFYIIFLGGAKGEIIIGDNPYQGKYPFGLSGNSSINTSSSKFE